LAALDQNIADVADIAQAVAERALRELVAEMGAESAEDEAELVVAIAVPVETAEHEEPAAGRDLPPHTRQVVGHRGEREFVPPHRRVTRVAAPQAAHRGVDLLECRRRQPHDPVVGLDEVLAKPDGPSARTIRRLECHQHLLHACRRSLCCIIFSPVCFASPACAAPLGPRPRLMWRWHSCHLYPYHLYSWTSHASRACPTCALYCETRASPGSLCCETRASPGSLCCETRASPGSLCCETRASPGSLCCETRASPGSLCCETRASPGFDGAPHGPMVCRLRLHLHPVDGCPARVQRGVWAGRVPNETCEISRSVSRRWHQRRACPHRRRQVAGEGGPAGDNRDPQRRRRQHRCCAGGAGGARWLCPAGLGNAAARHEP